MNPLLALKMLKDAAKIAGVLAREKLRRNFQKWNKRGK